MAFRLLHVIAASFTVLCAAALPSAATAQAVSNGASNHLRDRPV